MRNRTFRPLSRATRRNDARERGLLGRHPHSWRNTLDTNVKYRPYMTKPPVLSFIPVGGEWQLVGVRHRKQPKTYPYRSAKRGGGQEA